MEYALEACIVDFLASNGPSALEEIVTECRAQCPGYKNKRQVILTVVSLLNTGSIGKYDDTEAFELLSGEV